MPRPGTELLVSRTAGFERADGADLASTQCSPPPTPMLSITLVLSEERERESECAVVKCFRLHNTIQSKEFHRVECLQNTSGSRYSKLAFELHQRSQVIAHDESMLGFIQVSCKAHRSWKKRKFTVVYAVTFGLKFKSAR